MGEIFSTRTNRVDNMGVNLQAREAGKIVGQSFEQGNVLMGKTSY